MRWAPAPAAHTKFWSRKCFPALYRTHAAIPTSQLSKGLTSMFYSILGLVGQEQILIRAAQYGQPLGKPLALPEAEGCAEGAGRAREVLCCSQERAKHEHLV